MTRPSAPPPMSFFAGGGREAGPCAVCIDLAGLTMALEGLDEALAARLLERYVPYASAEGAPRAALRVSFSRDDRDYFITPPEIPEVNPVLLACDADRVRYLGYRLAGWFDVREGRGQIVLSRGTFEPDLRSIENYVRAAIAWQAALQGGALVHAASAVLKEQGYLFYGPSGAGKSTLSACNTRARVVSDDLSLVLPRREGGLDLVGSPFRGTYTAGPPVVGRFPLATGFRIVKAPLAEVLAVPRVRAFAELVANLPFLVDMLPEKPELFERFERTFASLPLYHLRFCKDDSYWDAIDRAGL